MALSTYSFLNFNCTITGPGGTFAIGSSSGAAEEGITFEMTSEKSTLVVGADGQPMYSLHAGQPGKATIRLLKTSPVNQLLSNMLNFQKLSSATWGQNTIVGTDSARGDNITCVSAAFAKLPNLTFANEAGTVEWEFVVGRIEMALGDGTPGI